LLLCGLLWVASALLVSSGTMAAPDAAASNRESHSGSEAREKGPLGMVWIPGGTFLMGTNDKESFPMILARKSANSRPSLTN